MKSASGTAGTTSSYKRTVDKCPDGVLWNGDLGVITTLIPKVKFNPKTTIAIVVGPPIMYRFVTQRLAEARDARGKHHRIA